VLLADYPTDKAWLRVGKMLFSDYEKFTTYDRYLTDRYYDPSQPAPDSFISKVTDRFIVVTEDPQRPAPAKLIREVSRAYFRLEQDNEIAAWFEAKGIDVSGPTIPKEEFERRFAEHRAGLVSTSKVSEATIADFTKNFFDSTEHWTMDGLEAACKKKYGSAPRPWLRKYYRAQMKKRGKTVKRGPRQKSAK
jgi:hypothetical protein